MNTCGRAGSEHTHGIHAFTIWTALSAEGLGASLQHYNPLVSFALRNPRSSRYGRTPPDGIVPSSQIDGDVAKEFDVPETWKLRAQLVFGKPVAPAGEKTFKPLEERVKVFA